MDSKAANLSQHTKSIVKDFKIELNDIQALDLKSVVNENLVPVASGDWNNGTTGGQEGLESQLKKADSLFLAREDIDQGLERLIRDWSCDDQWISWHLRRQSYSILRCISASAMGR